MSRPLRIEYLGAYYHVMNRGLTIQALLSQEADHSDFPALIKEGRQLAIYQTSKLEEKRGSRVDIRYLSVTKACSPPQKWAA